ncbi:MAG TPA: hypothetical protein VGG51_11980 [Candidatus Cybelea sp.]|jgi:hypothetical protein
MKQASIILALALLSLSARALGSETPESFQKQCSAAAAAHDDSGVITWCQRAAFAYASDAGSKTGEARSTALLHEAQDILYFSASEAAIGNIGMAQKAAVQGRNLFDTVASGSKDDATTAAARAGLREADTLIEKLAAKQP